MPCSQPDLNQPPEMASVKPVIQTMIIAGFMMIRKSRLSIISKVRAWSEPAGTLAPEPWVVDEEEERVVAATGGSHACTPRMDGITAIVTPTRFRDLKEERSLWKILHPTRHTRPVCLGRQ